MSMTQHMRALIRWIAPWQEDNRSFLVFYIMLCSVMLLLFAGLQNFLAIRAILGLSWLAAEIYLIIRVGVTIVLLLPLLLSRTRSNTWLVIKNDWCEKGEPRLFDGARTKREDRKVDIAFLCKQGFSRKSARKLSRELLR